MNKREATRLQNRYRREHDYRAAVDRAVQAYKVFCARREALRAQGGVAAILEAAAELDAIHDAYAAIVRGSHVAGGAKLEFEQVEFFAAT